MISGSRAPRTPGNGLERGADVLGRGDRVPLRTAGLHSSGDVDGAGKVLLGRVPGAVHQGACERYSRVSCWAAGLRLRVFAETSLVSSRARSMEARNGDGAASRVSPRNVRLAAPVRISRVVARVMPTNSRRRSSA